ncbi:MAG TPA: IPT/TIG domain-containing protein, partial [Thermoanaerobaculia bacterium]|nr:IPT/TIG domain-containing protein [Thermoanaerobaculia bacterium]
MPYADVLKQGRAFFAERKGVNLYKILCYQPIACVLLVLGSVLLPFRILAQAVPGDADANGGISQTDVAKILDTILSASPAPGDPDCTGDGIVDVLDVICVQKIIAETVPTVIGFEPASAKPGTLVTVHGSHFTASGGAPAVIIQRRGGGSIAAPVGNFNAASLTFTVPPGAATGPLTVTVTDRPATSSIALLTILPSSSFSFIASPVSLSLMRGQSAAVAVTLESSDGFSQLADPSVSGLPAGMTASLDPPHLAAGQTAILTLQAAPNAPTGSATLTLSMTATIDGVAETQQTAVGLNIRPVTTSFVGRIVASDSRETPLAGATVELEGTDGNGHATGCIGETLTDAAGNFAFTDLPAACAGPQIVNFNGLTTTSPPGVYASVYKLFTLVSGQAVTPPALVHLPRIDNGDTVMVRQNHPTAQTFTFPSIPDLTIVVPPGAIL